MKIWIFNEYGALPSQSTITRHYFFARQLQKMGHEPAVFVGSHPHNTKLQMIEGKERYRQEPSESFPWVYVKTKNYEGSKVKRVLSMFQYYRNAKKAAAAMAREHGGPDAIIGSSAHPLAAVLSIRLGKKYHCKAIAEVRDLWPESIVAYGIAGPKNPAVVVLRHLEKWIYKKADAVVFTMEGAYDYIVKQGWEKEIPRSKIHCINNGVDLEGFHYNREHFQVEDPDLQNPDIFKVVYTGSIRLVNNLGLLLDAAKLVKNPRVRFLVWGDGDKRSMLEQRVRDEGISNVVFKGKVEKKYIPYIVSKADLNFGHYPTTYLLQYGASMNKLFDYLAAEKPVLIDFLCAYNPVLQCGAGICVKEPIPEQIAQAVDNFTTIGEKQYQAFCDCARAGAQQYDFRSLTQKLLTVIESES